MKNLFVLFFLVSTVSLFSQEFDGTYKATYSTAQSDEGVQIGALKVKWWVVVAGNEITVYESKSLDDVVSRFTLGNSSDGDYRTRTRITLVNEKKNEFAISSTTVDDFTGRASTFGLLMIKQD